MTDFDMRPGAINQIQGAGVAGPGAEAIHPGTEAPKLDLISVISRLRAWMRAHTVMRDEDSPVRVTIEIGSRDAACTAIMQLQREIEPMMMYPTGDGRLPVLDLDRPVKIMGIEITFRTTERRAAGERLIPRYD